VFYVLHGQDEFSRSEALRKIESRLGDPSMVNLNTTRLDGSKATLSEIEHACATVPFLAKRRLVIVEGLLSRLDPPSEPGKERRSPSAGDKALAQKLLKYLERLPDSTALVFLENRSLGRKNTFVSLARKNKDKGYVREYPAISGDTLADWIRRRIRDKGARIDSEAVRELAAHTGGGLRAMDQELEKLATYAGPDGTITLKDVHLLVSPTWQASIFHMVDALGEKRARRALQLLHRLLEYREPPLRILAMITRQFRMMMQWRQLTDEGHSGQEVREIAGIRPRFVADKVSRQARNFSLPQLKAIYHQLLNTDQQIKTGRMDAVLALDLLVVEVSLRRNLAAPASG